MLCAAVVHLFLFLYSIQLCDYTIIYLSIDSTIDRHLDSFQFATVINNEHSCISTFVYVCIIYLGVDC